MPDSELYKITCYFEEGSRLRLTSPAGAAEKDAYESWECVQRPMPFLLNDKTIELAEKQISIPDSDVPVTGFYLWDTKNNCAALMLETPQWGKKILLKFRQGVPVVSEEKTVKLKNAERRQGEILEFIYDIINRFRLSGDGREMLKLTKKELTGKIDDAAPDHNPEIAGMIKKLSLSDVRELIKTASADMASDELSGQLSLGLDGTYASGTDDEDEEITCPAADIPDKTRWNIISNLNFLSSMCKLRADNEKEFILTFGSAQIVGNVEYRETTLKLHINPDAPLRQGDLLHVRWRGNKTASGTFMVDIFEGKMLYGRLRCDVPMSIKKDFKSMYANLPKSPSEFLASGVEAVHSMIRNMEDDKLSPALKFILGLKPFSFNPSAHSNRAPAPNMDKSQIRALNAAMNSGNPVVLVQGPPGTGKTFVLEHLLRQLCKQGLRILTAAPSNTAVDNICRRLSDMPVLRFGSTVQSIAPDVAKKSWVGNKNAIDRFVQARRKFTGGIYAGTNVGLLKDQIVTDDMKRNGRYDVIVFDEAGMSNIEEFILCSNFGKRVVLFGDHQQLPPFPLPHAVQCKLKEKFKAVPEHLHNLVGNSALQYMAEERGVPVIMLRHSYRCQNPRLLRFASTLFYDACVKTSYKADYYSLPYHERERRYPPSTMRLYSTSGLPEFMRTEQLCFDGKKPGLANKTEALICAEIFYQAAEKYPLEEISIIAPYRKQVSLLREILTFAQMKLRLYEKNISEEQWQNFAFSRIATVDSFQGGESDVVIICYVRSNKEDGIGFIENPNRINVAHTRCRREMHIVGDMNCIKHHAETDIFERLERAFRRDGEILKITRIPSATTPLPTP
ncbi:MAG: hypothetical protein A2017_02915 [Lentisphaerae bacterium GWF2_44_16]|nr:MAG: hypothetical protein A2017_02915 [Lentisphaerae bacterium GWF2_44_16]